MSLVIALHGNPGHPQDWEILAEYFSDFMTVDAYTDDWIDIVKKGIDKKILIGHSWGAYRILKALPQIAQHVEKIVLLAPYVNVEHPLPSIAAALLRAPWLGKKLIKSNHQKIKDSFINDLIHPFTIEGLPYYQELQNKLQDWQLWERAALNKIRMQENPWTDADISDVPIYVFTGEQDKISNESLQNEVLKKYPNIHFKMFKDTGHGLLWSHASEIAKEILRESSIFCSDDKIGYFPGTDKRNNVISYIEKHVHEFPDRIALRWANREAIGAWDGTPLAAFRHDEISFKNFFARIDSFARGLSDIGITKGDRVIIFLPMSLDMYTAMFAVQRIGAIAVFLDSWARSHHLGATAECVSPKAMISFKMAFDLVDQVPEFSSMPVRILYGTGEKFTHRFENLLKIEKSEICAVESEFTALITFTTGSTGKPKGANRTHRFLSAQHQALSHVIPYTDRDIDMPAFPIFSLNNLAAGVTTVLPALDLSAPSEKDSAILVSQLFNQQINCTTLSPSMLVGLAKFCKDKNIQLDKLRRVVTGGAPISKDDVKAFYEIAPQTELWILYGSTEAEPMAHIEGRDMLREKASLDPEIVEEGVNVGQISEDIDFKFIRIQDSPVELTNGSWDDVEVPVGHVGEFICTGDHVCREYYNNPQAFKTTKVMDAQNRVWHRTGDLAYIDSDRNLWIVGRTNNAIERAGEYLFPVRAEVLLKRLAFTYRCAFLGIEDNQLGEATYAVIELKAEIDAKNFDFESARNEILRVFVKNKIPVDQIRFVHKVPMDPRHHSKVEYKLLRDQLRDPGVVIA